MTTSQGLPCLRTGQSGRPFTYMALVRRAPSYLPGPWYDGGLPVVPLVWAAFLFVRLLRSGIFLEGAHLLIARSFD